MNFHFLFRRLRRFGCTIFVQIIAWRKRFFSAKPTLSIALSPVDPFRSFLVRIRAQFIQSRAPNGYLLQFASPSARCLGWRFDLNLHLRLQDVILIWAHARRRHRQNVNRINTKRRNEDDSPTGGRAGTELSTPESKQGERKNENCCCLIRVIK